MKVATIQMVSTGDLPENLRVAGSLLEQAAATGAELAVLPEYFCLIGLKDADKLAIQEPFGEGPIQSFVATRARELGLWIVAGTLPLSASQADHVFNSSLAYNPQGECVARYDKIHLFRFSNGTETYDESRVLERGSTPTVFALPSRDGHTWSVGMSVCYDMRFAELYREYAKRGVDLLLAPSAFTYTTGEAHWEILLRARAIENQCYVLAPAQGGRHQNGRRTWGHTMLIDPWGEVLQVLPEGAGVVAGTLQRQRIADVRRSLPALTHRIM